ncbi:MAG TPA: thioredoxin family protein [Kofleriaceae bacterium]|nr:thioredoxin family protein [Kofleriaceae bacterium]
MTQTPRLLVMAMLTMAWLGHARAEGPMPGTLEEEIAQAKAAHKPLILEFYTSWCHPCETFEKETLKHSAVAALLPTVHLVRYDAENGNGIAVAAKYKVRGYPTLLALDETGKVRNRMLGGPTAKEFVVFLQASGAVVASEAHVLAERKRLPTDAATALRTAQWLVARDRFKDALPHFDDAVRLDKANKGNVGGPAAWQAGEIRRSLAARASAVVSVRELLRTFPGEAAAVPALVAVSSELSPQERATLWGLVIEVRSKDLAALNELAYQALAADALDAALDIAKRMDGLMRPPRGKMDPGKLDTMAEVYHYRRDSKQALQIEDEALALEKDPAGRAGLVANRARFAATEFVPLDEVSAKKQAIAKMWQRVGALTPAAPSGDDGDADPAMASAMAYYGALRESLATVGAGCVAAANGMDEAYVRLTLTDAGKIAKVTVMEPDASKQLTTCLTAGLLKVTLPAVPAGMAETLRSMQVQPVPLGKPAAK